MSNNASGGPLSDANLTALAVDWAHEAGMLLANRPVELGVQTKSSPTDVVTVMDKQSEALIVRRITESRPGDGILGEEGASREGTSGVRWIVDPLDGTVNYLYGLPAYSVSIAAERDGEVVAGAVFDARNGKLFEATRGGGARFDGNTVRCNDITDLGQALIGTGFSYDSAIRAEQGASVARLLPQVANIRRIGSAALDLCHVAAGMLDGFYESDIKPWDRAAAVLIATEAGALATVRPDSPSMTICAAPGIFPALCAAV